MLKDQQNTYQNKGIKFLLIKLKENLNLLAHLDTGNQHNCSKMCAMLSLFKEFITEFESTWVIILKQLFAEGEDKIEE